MKKHMFSWAMDEYLRSMCTFSLLSSRRPLCLLSNRVRC